jgi:predicted adenine nucleotide alpha hydrolase (AANH) superfamily ATPase
MNGKQNHLGNLYGGSRSRWIEMKLLLQTCCGPCLTGSRISFEEEEMDLVGLWFNPNIHPRTEYDRRLQTLQRYIYLHPMEMVFIEEYPLFSFLTGMMKDTCSGCSNAGSKMSQSERTRRCSYCYRTRLMRTALVAKDRGIDHFSTTMLISKHQDHNIIRRIGDECAQDVGLDFVYKDLRIKWKESISISRSLRMYRQPYCGCIFSEQERYAGSDGFGPRSKDKDLDPGPEDRDQDES